MAGRDGPWVRQLADSLYTAYRADVPDAALDRAGLQLFDSVACAAGAHDAAPVAAVRQVISASGPGEASVWFRGSVASVADAVLANGTAVRFLDANDVFLGSKGPGGHPSDNIVVAMAVAERAGASGRDLLAAIVLGYELMWRLRGSVFRRLPGGSRWDAVSISGPVCAAMTALLLGAGRDTLAHALAIGAVKGYTLREIRGGDISMLKAAGNATVAREGMLAGMLAMAGMTGPSEVFEGRDGIVATLGGQPEEAMIAELCAPPQWVVHDVSIKPFPAFGTAQAAIHGATVLTRRHGLRAADIAEVRVRVPDTEWTRRRREVQGRSWPQTRESADHSLTFLVSLALLRGDVLSEHYDAELWQDPEVRALMARTVVHPDPGLAAAATTDFPATVEVLTSGGAELRQEVRHPPGSPSRPWGIPEITEKFLRLDRAGTSEDEVAGIGAHVAGLAGAPGVGPLAALLRGAGRAAPVAGGAAT